ncbi:MAG: ATPase [Chloroflexi bacterium]|nr:ATPase [Chloroflexota bacterium]
MADGWLSVAELPLLILVGVTGVGKSTTLALLEAAAPPVRQLPDRRALADLLITKVQLDAGEALRAVTDRAERFDYTRRYREQNPGGLAQALSQLWIDPARWPQPLCFDGLRGADEVGYAAQQLPHARFAVLDAPDVVRVERLLGRGDRFDRLSTTQSPTEGGTLPGLDVPGAGALFTPDEQARLSALVTGGAVSAADLRAKVAIVVTERQNYDPAAAIAALQRLAPGRTVVVDTTQCTPQEAARVISTYGGVYYREETL